MFDFIEIGSLYLLSNKFWDETEDHLELVGTLYFNDTEVNLKTYSEEEEKMIFADPKNLDISFFDKPFIAYGIIKNKLKIYLIADILYGWLTCIDNIQCAHYRDTCSVNVYKIKEFI